MMHFYYKMASKRYVLLFLFVLVVLLALEYGREFSRLGQNEDSGWIEMPIFLSVSPITRTPSFGEISRNLYTINNGYAIKRYTSEWESKLLLSAYITYFEDKNWRIDDKQDKSVCFVKENKSFAIEVRIITPSAI